MALPRVNFELSDVSVWGVAALICGALAVLSANISGMIPENVIAGLHTTRLDGGNINQVRAQMAEVRAENTRMIRDTRAMLSRLNLLDDDSGEMIRRLAAVERSLPLLIESLPLNADIDRSLLTASIAVTSPEVYEENGGIIIVRQSALFEDVDDPDPMSQPMPPVPETPGYGIALGSEIPRDFADAMRRDILLQAGQLLGGLRFRYGEAGALDNTRVVAGPLSSFEDANILCEPLTIMGIDCEPVPFEGETWPL